MPILGTIYFFKGENMPLAPCIYTGTDGGGDCVTVFGPGWEMHPNATFLASGTLSDGEFGPNV